MTTLDWSFGLQNHTGKYLTAESFNKKLVCAASKLKKKQIFFLEQEEGSDVVYIKTHLDCYLSVDGDGKFLADSSDKSDEAAFTIEPQEDGKWAIKSNKYGWYTGGTGENLTAFVKEISADRLWTVHLAMHPQVNLRNVMRKAYVHLKGNQFTTDEIVPWGDDATVTIIYHGFEHAGTYGLETCDGQFLTTTGELSANGEDPNAQFILEFQGGMVSFKSRANGKYVTSLGAAGTLKASKSSISKDEQFVMEESYAQISLKAKNGKFVSTRQGVELAASKEDMTDDEIFQVEPLGGGQWHLKSCKPKYFSLNGNSVTADSDNKADAESFGIEWRGTAIALKASNGKYVVQQMNNYLAAKESEATAENGGEFTFEIVNRPRLVLRGEYGFVGTLPSGLLECNKATPEVYAMSVSNGKVQIAHENGKFWKIGSNGISCTGAAPEDYTVELFEGEKIAIRGPDGKYFMGTQNGSIKVDGSGPTNESLFQY